MDGSLWEYGCCCYGVETLVGESKEVRESLLIHGGLWVVGSKKLTRGYQRQI